MPAASRLHSLSAASAICRKVSAAVELPIRCSIAASSCKFPDDGKAAIRAHAEIVIPAFQSAAAELNEGDGDILAGAPKTPSRMGACCGLHDGGQLRRSCGRQAR